MENLNYKDRSMERKYLKMRENQFLKVKNSLLELEKRFYRIEIYRIERYRCKN